MRLYQAVGVMCLAIAIKFEETDVVSLNELVTLTDGAMNQHDVRCIFIFLNQANELKVNLFVIFCVLY